MILDLTTAVLFPIRMTGPLQGDTYPSFLQFLGLEFFQELTKFVLEEVSLFHVLNFNVVLVGRKDID